MAGVAQAAVFQKYTGPQNLSEPVRGYDFDKGVDLDALLESYRHFGFQATSFSDAVEEIKRMLHWRLVDDPIVEGESDDMCDPEVRKKVKCTIFLSYTSNMASCGVRDVIRYLVKHKMVDCIVATAGGIEEDLIKCLAPTFHGEFSMDGASLRSRGMNRIGNLIVPNDNYCKFEEWIMPIFAKMHEEQKTNGTVWSPSSLIRRLGQEIDNEESIYYWCAKNNIPVFSPAITDGSIGDMIYFYTYKHDGFVIDVVQDIRAINDIALKAKCTGAVILGGGVVKHHVLNANLMRNGCRYCVFVNTANEFDGSDSGARPDEAVSWGKIALGAKPVKVYGEATLIFPLLVAQTFARHGDRDKYRSEE